ncbi:hypothetical protein [Polynucleobacter sp. MWH-Braz-FAM2G]|uniref:hypothetical protein n=1 Tax=Polynucleobacter sp. MWH-Braz-FAM2G TaxID=1855883 RepID=UPI001BFE24F9|nr:hypothetical protein [Polynucleobacter sp. MWH-Braz-FAM2G]QWD90229.1 hypothetical protein FD973_08010 [Polynucleobacter sp. MWH-Braz-FAM2G]
MDFDWFSDPLLLYALSLAGLLFGGIFVLILTIVIKHGSRLRSKEIQQRVIALLDQAKNRSHKGESIQHQLNSINSLIHLYKKDVAYGWVRLLEQTPASDRKEYVEVAIQTDMLHCIPHCLNEEGLAEKCIALEAIGLSNFQEFVFEVKKYVDQAGIAPYACIALARLIGKEALSQIIESYEKGFLNITQALAAMVEIPRDQLIQYSREARNKNFPKRLLRYLVAT